jgi:hypothetical protein
LYSRAAFCEFEADTLPCSVHDRLFSKTSKTTIGDVLYKPDLPRIFFDTVRQLLLRRRQQKERLDQPDDDDDDSQQPSSSDASGRSSSNSGDGIGILWLCHVPRSTVTHELVVQAAHQGGFTIKKTISLDDNSVGSSSKLLGDTCPMEDVTRARVYRMVLPKDVPADKDSGNTI